MNSPKPRSQTGEFFLGGILFLAVFFSLGPISNCFAGININLDLNYNSGGNSSYYLTFVELSTNSLSTNPADTGYLVSSSSAGVTGQFLPDGSSPYSGNGYGDFGSFLADITNVWTLTVTNLTSTNIYQFTFSNFQSNQIPKVTMVYPLEGDTNVPTVPTYVWAGPSSNYDLYVQASDNYGFYDYASLPANQTSWTSPDTLSVGSNYVISVSYHRDGGTFITSSTPTNALGQPVAGWSSTCSIYTYSSSDFTVGTAAPSAPSSGYWAYTSPLTNAVYLHTATLLPSGKVLVAGGNDYNGNVFSSVEIYDPTTGKWAATNGLSKGRYLHTATLLNNGKVLVAGGTSNQYSASNFVQTVELFNPTDSTWSNTGSMISPRTGHTATLLANGKVLVAGGLGKVGANPNPTNIYTAEIYDPATGTWTATGSLAYGRYNHTATLLPNGQVLVTGGLVTNVTLVTASCEIYDPTTGVWTTTGSLPVPLANHTATLLNNGTILVAGGDIDEGGFGGIGLYPVNNSQVYDPSTGVWTAVGVMNVTHEFHTATLLNNGYVLVAGYGSYFGTNLDAELYDPASKTWYAAGQMRLTTRTKHTATLLPSGRVMVAGGAAFTGLAASAEIYSLLGILLTNPTVLGSHSFQFAWTNFPGSTNVVIASTNVTLTQTNWSSLGTGTEVTSGHFQFTDTQATNSVQRYYRVTVP